MARRVRVTTWHARTASRVLRDSSSRPQAVGRTVRALAASRVLPGAADYEASEKRVGRSWVRRVAGCNLWLWYRFTREELVLLTVSTEPPVPLHEAAN